MVNIYTQGDEAVKEEFRQLIKSSLQKGQTTVVFEKIDGTQRTMVCTLDPSLLPVVEVSEDAAPKKERKPNPEVQVAFDIEKQEWRSFRYDKIISVEIA